VTVGTEQNHDDCTAAHNCGQHPEWIIGLTRDELRAYALDEQRLHDPHNQADNPYERCALCHYTHHPCEVHDLATAVLTLLNA
jgi:hypothetical protein